MKKWLRNTFWIKQCRTRERGNSPYRAGETTEVYYIFNWQELKETTLAVSIIGGAALLLVGLGYVGCTNANNKEIVKVCLEKNDNVITAFADRKNGSRSVYKTVDCTADKEECIWFNKSGSVVTFTSGNAAVKAQVWIGGDCFDF